MDSENLADHPFFCKLKKDGVSHETAVHFNQRINESARSCMSGDYPKTAEKLRHFNKKLANFLHGLYLTGLIDIKDVTH